ncbi:MAG TPA: hypothetical protein VFV66_19380 [Nonomuraea sp.]|nr:hypothetical protein [Nonomuraea sp.]
MEGVIRLGAAAERRPAAPETAVVILTAFGEDDHTATALDVGAAGFPPNRAQAAIIAHEAGLVA